MTDVLGRGDTKKKLYKGGGGVRPEVTEKAILWYTYGRDTSSP